MNQTNISPNMNLPVPIVGVTLGQDWALDINSCQLIIDSHDHSSGKGVQITPNGLNINSDLAFGLNNATFLRSVRFTPSTVSGSSDLGCLYESGVDLYYVDGNGNQIRITENGGIAGTPGSISNLTSPASAAYVSANETFVWQSGANTAANLDAGSLILRNITAGSNGLTLSPPSTIASNYTITLPQVPSVASVVTIDTSGNLGTIPTQNAGNPSGAIIAFGGVSAPTGWLLCDGSAVSRTTYSALFAAIGTAYGYGDNSTTFNIPDLRGQFLRGVSGSSARDPGASTRTAMNTGGNTGNNVGSIQGAATAVNGLGLTDPGHAHTSNTTTGSGTVRVCFNEGPSSTSPISTNTATTGISITSTDSETRPINAYVNFIIKT